MSKFHITAVPPPVPAEVSFGEGDHTQRVRQGFGVLSAKSQAEAVRKATALLQDHASIEAEKVADDGTYVEMHDALKAEQILQKKEEERTKAESALLLRFAVGKL